MAADLLVVHVQSGQAEVRLALVGELDRSVVETLAHAFRKVSVSHATTRVVIDVSRLEFCDLGGQRELLRCREAGATLVGAPPCLQRLCTLTGHAHLLPAAPDGSWRDIVIDSGAREAHHEVEVRGANELIV